MVYFAIWFAWAVLTSVVIVVATYWREDKKQESYHSRYRILTAPQRAGLSCVLTVLLASLLAFAIIATVSVLG